MSQIAIVEAFADLPDTRRSAGQRHRQALCLALFTLAVAAGNRGFLAIGDWLSSFFGITPNPGETIAVDGKVLRGSHENAHGEPQSHFAVGWVER